MLGLLLKPGSLKKWTLKNMDPKKTWNLENMNPRKYGVNMRGIKKDYSFINEDHAQDLLFKRS